MKFDIIGPLQGTETIASGAGTREVERLRQAYGAGRWLKRKAIARVRLADETESLAEVHWYEAHGLGRFEFKIKQLLDDEESKLGYGEDN